MHTNGTTNRLLKMRKENTFLAVDLKANTKEETIAKTSVYRQVTIHHYHSMISLNALISTM